MKSRMSIDPKLIKLLGRKLYNHHPVVIIPRELLQNSHDATRGEELPYIRIKIFSHSTTRTIIECEDNGIGMDEDTLVNKFLCLGGTTKDKGTTVGGFGIAKAAIMSGSFWSIHTNDLYTSSVMVENDREVARVKPRKGTLVRVWVSETTYSSEVIKACHMIYGSETKIDLFAKGMYGEAIYDTEAGFRCRTQPEPAIHGSGWNGYIVRDQMRDPDEKLFIQGLAFVRLKGLVQFVLGLRFDSLRKSNLFIDLETTETPDSKEFPLTMSRESITDTVIHTEVSRWKNDIEDDYKGTDDPPKDDPNMLLLDGLLLEGTKTYQKLGDFDSNGEAWDVIGADTVVGITTGGIMIRFFEITDENLEEISNLIDVWGKILTMVVPKGIQFGVGVIGSDAGAETVKTNHSLHFLVNPKSATITNPLLLYSMAVHEVAHLWVSTHNEMFAMTMHQIFKATAKDIEVRIL